MTKGLDELAHFHGTDKRSGLHGYVRFYSRLLENLPVKITKVLEIGIYQGASLRMWSDYLPEATIDGIDINQNHVITYPRVRCHIFNQSDAEALNRLAAEQGPWDLVVDDASHKTSDQLASFQALWPHVTNGGLYVIEDTYLSFDLGYADQGLGKLYEHFADFVREQVRGGYHCDQHRTMVELVEYSAGMIAIQKAL